MQAYNAKAKALWEAEFKAFVDNLAAQNATTLKFRELNLKFTPLAAADKISQAKLRWNFTNGDKKYSA